MFTLIKGLIKTSFALSVAFIVFSIPINKLPLFYHISRSLTEYFVTPPSVTVRSDTPSLPSAPAAVISNDLSGNAARRYPPFRVIRRNPAPQPPLAAVPVPDNGSDDIEDIGHADYNELDKLLNAAER